MMSVCLSSSEWSLLTSAIRAGCRLGSPARLGARRGPWRKLPVIFDRWHSNRFWGWAQQQMQQMQYHRL
jgi:hypothetical protein